MTDSSKFKKLNKNQAEHLKKTLSGIIDKIHEQTNNLPQSQKNYIPIKHINLQRGKKL